MPYPTVNADIIPYYAIPSKYYTKQYHTDIIPYQIKLRLEFKDSNFNRRFYDFYNFGEQKNETNHLELLKKSILSVR